ncbi:MAG: phosphate ABC transporter substrate-binding protein, partial [Woeseia sp.]|nr:phosphate ABC transporter substrate-binding protein [Woeseia sp.]
MTKRSTALALLASVAMFVVSTTDVQAQAGRDYIYIVGSSTVYPFSTVVAERFGRGGNFKTPKVESTGTGGGMKLFCDGVGVDYPDISNASRAIKASEIANCAANGVADIIEVKVGYDGIVVANSRKSEPVTLSRRAIFLALAKVVPGAEDGTLIPNPYQQWNEIDPTLPAEDIEVLGPPP